MKPGPKPRTLSRELLDQIEQHASRGLSQQQICHSLGISESWWYDEKQKIRKYRIVLKEVRPTDLLRSQMLSLNRHSMVQPEQHVFI